MNKLLVLAFVSFLLIGCGGGGSDPQSIIEDVVDDAVEEVIEDAVDDVADVVEDTVVDVVEDAVGDAEDAVVEAVEDAVEDAEEAVDDAENTVEEAVDDLLDDNTDESSGLYTGYYFEDAATNPEDPTVGALYLNLPSEGAFSGSMYFTYFGCQSENVGAISGTKSSGELSGDWSGSVDGDNQSGSYDGTFNSAESRYTGTYTVDAGKQYKNIEDCIEYYIAPKGTWVLYPQNTSTIPNSCSVTNGVVSWNPPASSAISLVSVLDTDLAQSGSTSATVFQQIVVSQTSLQLPSSLQAGKSYLATISSFNEETENVYYCNIGFIQ